MVRYFNNTLLPLTNKAFSDAEKLVAHNFRISEDQLKKNKYDVKTLAYLEQHEIKEGAFAHLCKYSYGKTDSRAEKGGFEHFMLKEIFEFEIQELTSKDPGVWGHWKESDPMPIRELHQFISKTYLSDQIPAMAQILLDHISLMTDRYARNLFEEIVLPKPIGRMR